MSERPAGAERIDFSALDWEDHSTGVRFKGCVADGKQVRFVEVDPDCEQDWCVTGHAGYVLEGCMEVEFAAGGSETFNAGDGLIVRGGEAWRHRPRAVGSVVRLVLVEDV